jgi:predicted Zn-dependent protease
VVLDTVGWVMLRRGDADGALEMIEKAHELKPESPVLSYHLGVVLLKLNRLDEAREKLAAALESQEDFPGKADAAQAMAQLTAG